MDIAENNVKCFKMTKTVDLLITAQFDRRNSMYRQQPRWVVEMAIAKNCAMICLKKIWNVSPNSRSAGMGTAENDDTCFNMT